MISSHLGKQKKKKKKTDYRVKMLAVDKEIKAKVINF